MMVRQIKSLLYQEGFTIGGARQKLSSEEAKLDATQSRQLVKQVVAELEQVLEILK
jgi:hypothetical protein